MKVEDKKVVKIHYTLKNDEGNVLDTSDGKEPLAYIHGTSSVIPGLENALVGKAAGDKVSTSIKPEEGYGVYDDKNVTTVPLTQFDQADKVTPGAQFQLQTPEGIMIATVQSVDETNVVIDTNHPLAGKTLHFDLEVVEIRAAEEEELGHGHVHGEGGVKH